MCGDADVLAHDAVFCELGIEFFVNVVVFGDEHEPGGVAIDAMHDAWAFFATKLGECGICEQATCEGGLAGVTSWIDEQVTGFVDDEQVWILVDDVEVHGNRCGTAVLFCKNELTSLRDLGAGFAQGLAIQADEPFFDTLLESGARKVAVFGDPLVEALAFGVSWYGESLGCHPFPPGQTKDTGPNMRILHRRRCRQR